MPQPQFGKVWDEMHPGEIYSEGGYEGGGEAMGPSYEIFQQRNSIRRILDEAGYTDMMLAKEESKRKKHIEKIIELTGAKIIGEEEYTRKADPEKANKWGKLPDMDKMMVSQVAQGQMQPEEYQQKKMEQDQKIRDAFIVLAQSEQAQFRKEGKKVPTTGGAVRDFIEGGETAIEFKPRTSIQRHISSGGGKGGRRAKRDLPKSNLQKELDTLTNQLKGHGGKIPETLNESREKVQVAVNLQMRDGGPGALDDNQAKIDADGIIKAQEALEKIVAEMENFPERAEEIAGDLTYYEPFLQDIPVKQYNKILELKEKFSFEEILKRLRLLTGKNPSVETSEEGKKEIYKK